MKRKITIKTLIIAIMITAILSGTVGVIAVKLSAKDVGFTASNEEWQVNNVEDAMNDLYKIGSEVLENGADLIYKNAMKTSTSTFHYHDYEIALPEGKKTFYAVVVSVTDYSLDVPILDSNKTSISHNMTNITADGAYSRYISRTDIFTITTDGTGGTINIKPYLQAAPSSGVAMSYITVVG